MVSNNKQEVISFYNTVAPNYNDLVNAEVRQLVANYVRSHIKGVSTLDFGGGTGLDLHWLSNLKQRVIFCEISAAMRQKALELIQTERLSNIEVLPVTAADFQTWQVHDFKVDTVLSNLCALNSIANLEYVFKAFAHRLNPNGQAFLVVLDASPKSLFKNGWRLGMKAIFNPKNIQTKVHYKSVAHKLHVHTFRELAKSYQSDFEYVHHFDLTLGLICLHLKKRTSSS